MIFQVIQINFLTTISDFLCRGILPRCSNRDHNQMLLCFPPVQVSIQLMPRSISEPLDSLLQRFHVLNLPGNRLNANAQADRHGYAPQYDDNPVLKHSQDQHE